MEIFSRRKALLSILTGSFATTSLGRSSDAIQIPHKGIFLITSPKDGFIRNVSVQIGSKINLDAEICKLEDEDESHAQARLKSAQELLDIEALKLENEITKNQRRVLEIGLEISQAYLDFAKTKLQYYDTINTEDGPYGLKNGVTRGTIYIPAQAAVMKAEKEVEKSLIALTKYDFNLSQAKKKLSIAQSTLTIEKSFLEAKHNRLILKATSAGKVTACLAQNSFVKKGHVICVIEN